MKRIRLFTMVLISILLILIVGNVTATSQDMTHLCKRDNKDYDGDNLYLWSGSGSVFGYYDDLYCASAGQLLNGGWYKKAGTVRIIGDTTTVTNRNGEVLFEGYNAYGNYVAASLYLDSLGDEGGLSGANHSTGFISGGQLCFWTYGNEWRRELNAGAQTLLNGNMYIHCGYHDEYTAYAKSKAVVEAYVAQHKCNVEFDVFKINQNWNSQSVILVTTFPREETIDIPVMKEWNDNDNQDGKRGPIKVTLYKNGEATNMIQTLDESNNWKVTFNGLQQKDEDGNEIKYTIKESGMASGYTVKIDPEYITASSENIEKGFTITNTHEPEKIKLKIVKDWNDDDDRDGKRAESVVVAIMKNGQIIENDIKLTENNNWTYTSEELDKYQNGELIEYSVKETSVPEGYTVAVTNSAEIDKIVTYTVKNTHKPETINIPVTKKWEDGNNSYGDRPTEIEVTLKYSNGERVTTNADGQEIENPVKLNEENGWKYTFGNLNKYEKHGQEVQYTVEESQVDNYEEPIITENESGFIITNTHIPDGYIEISGKVWLDIPDGKANDINGKLDDDESGIGGIKVTLKDANGKQFDATSTAVTSEDGTYTIKVNYDNSKNVYKLYEDSNTVKTKLNTAYVEFEYDGIKYTTVSTAKTGADTSKAIENEKTRSSIDNAHSTVTSSTKNPDEWTDTAITASTKDVITFENYEDITTTKKEVTLKYCNGDGTYIRTNPEVAWKQPVTGKDDSTCTDGKGHIISNYEVDVDLIQNVNLGLFEREQPDVAIFSDLSKVEVTMNGQKYTYLYGVRSNASNEVGLKVKFQNKDTYTYRRPVNPADIAYIQEDAHKDAMSVYVTYEIKVGNLSSTLPITVHNITNYYDSRYTLNTEGWTTTSGNQYNQATYNGDLNITVDPLSESKSIELTYTVNIDAIKALLNEDATLNNAVEIQSYSTQYGEKTLYAEQNSGGRTGNAYAGYDYNSHPGNAEIFINNEGRLEAKKPEDDTDIAPSFVLCKDESRILSGTVWEDTDANESDKERVGDGHKADGEKLVENVKVELLKVKDDDTTETAKLYDKNGNSIEAIVYTDENGYYSFGNDDYSVVTDTYIIKFTYGDGIETGATKIGETIVNARNYKSTIISDGNVNVYNLFKGTSASDEWHLNTTKGYSIAVDDLEKRNAIPDLQYSNFNDKINMTAYSKPFKMQVEYDPSEAKESSVGENGDTTFGKELDVFDFGIIERAKEDIFVETLVEHLKVTLGNGQVLTEGNPNGEMSYVKAVGLNQSITKGSEALTALEKQVIMEMDAELIQGAELEVKYSIKVTNNSEMDYDETGYYYFGVKSEGAQPIKDSVNYLVDYIDAELSYTWENEDDWTKVTANDLRKEGEELVSEETIKNVESGKYIAYATTKFSELAPGESKTDYLTASKLLANQDENTYDNHAEILQIDTKTARTLKDYKSGNYVPSLETRVKNTDVNMEIAGYHEQDDDRIKVMVTPPTGTTNHTITYTIVTLITLAVMVVGIVTIKKKVLTK